MIGDRRFNYGERKVFEVTRVWDVHREVARRIVVGQKNTEIAKALGVSEAMVSYTRNSRIIKDRLGTLGERRDENAVNLAAEIKLKAPKALKLLEAILDGDEETLGDSPSIPLRASTAEHWLDRAGYIAPKGGDLHLHAHKWYKDEDIEAIKQRARDAGMIRDITPEGT